MSGDAKRIVSLLPGATEWVCELGLQDRLVGVSHECDYPLEVTKLPRVTRSPIDPAAAGREIDAIVRSLSDSRTPLFDLDSETLRSLEPDLILTQSLCNVCAVSERVVLETVAGLNHPCNVLDLRGETFDQVIDDAKRIAEAAGARRESELALNSLESRIVQTRQRAAETTTGRPVVTLLEWITPLFCAGHWTPQLIQWAGGDDPIGDVGHPSREITLDELAAADPDMLLVACCGMNLQQTQRELRAIEQSAQWLGLRCVKTGWLRAFDGSSYFNRPGPRLVDALEDVAELIRQWQNAHGAKQVVPLSL